jgi:cyclopropane fatty-acyl-phospholipid synthase-like methyltransferase
MSQVEHGVKNLLGYSAIYNLFQWLVGATRARKRVMKDFVQVNPGMSLLDIGCGPGSIIKYLPSSVKYFGIDSNPKYIVFAEKKFLTPYQFACININDSNSLLHLPKFDIVLALGILHHLSDAESSKLLEFASQAMGNSGRLITLDGCYTSNQSKISKYLLKHDRGQNVRTEKEYISLAEKSFTKVRTTISHDMMRIPYTLLVMECSK